MYQIPQGVTGRITGKEIDISEFKTFCYSLQGLGLFKVIRIKEYRYPDNFYQAEVEDRESKYCIYINYCTLVVGFSQISEIYKIGGSFIDKQLLKEAIEELNSKYLVALAKDLNSEANKKNFVLLGEDECKEIAYFYPNTIGQVLFSRVFD